MKNSQELAKTIKEIAKGKNIAIGTLLSDCQLSRNTLSSMQSGGYFPRLEAISKIADYLGVSVDYLLGREANIKKEPDTSGELSVKNVKFIGRDGVVKYKKLTPEMISMLEQLPDSDEDL